MSNLEKNNLHLCIDLESKKNCPVCLLCSQNWPQLNPKQTQNGPFKRLKIDRYMNSNGLQLDRNWTTNGPKVNPKRTQSGPKVDPK